MVSRMTSGQLCVIKETSSTVLTPQEEAKPCEMKYDDFSNLLE